MKKKILKDNVILNLLLIWIMINGLIIIGIIKIKEIFRMKK
jgi:hypothetical protein